MIDLTTSPPMVPTVRRILEGAESLLCRTPLQFVTANGIAKEAGMSIGALYRIYGDKQSVLDALAGEHVNRIQEWLETRVMVLLERNLRGGTPNFKPIEFLENVIDTYIAYLDENVAFRVLALGQLNSAGVVARHASAFAALPWVLKSFLVQRIRVPNTPELDLKLRVLTETCERLIAFAYEQKTSEMRGLVLAEMKEMLAGYLFVRAA